MMDITDEKELVQRLRNGDFEAFEQLYRHYRKRLAGNFVKLLRSDVLAQDALPDLFLKVWNARATIDPTQSFRSSIYRIAENPGIDIYRTAARAKKLMQQLLAVCDSGYTHVEEHIISEENIRMVRQIIAQLPAQQKKVYTLHKLEGKSYEEISVLLRISPSTINKHIYRAHRFVKSQLLKAPQFTITLILTTLLAGM